MDISLKDNKGAFVIDGQAASEARQRRVQIKISHLHKTFNRRRGSSVRAISDVSLEVQAGEIVVLLGPSGCGKTTLLRCVAGLEIPDSGEIEINGCLVYSSERKINLPPQARPGLNMMFQSYALWPHMTVWQNIAYPLEAQSIAKPEMKALITRVIELLNLSGLEDQYPGQCSGGQQQRVALARAIVGKPSVILFDEPLSNIDARVREKVRLELRILQRSLKYSGLYVTHDQEEAMELGHRVAVLKEGKVAQLGTPQEIYRAPKTEYVGSFVGTANILSGVVQETGDTVIVATAIGSVSVSTARSDPFELVANDPIKLMFRPEDVSLDRHAYESKSNCWLVTVIDGLFMGSRTRYIVRIGEIIWTVFVPGKAETISEGSQVWLHVPPTSWSATWPATKAEEH